MTDRNPDDLYDALHKRLADYGQEPSAPLWANIRAQLPPPVAAPRLRPRRRSVLLVGLLLAVLSAATWHWWPAPRVGRAVTAQRQPAAAGPSAPTNGVVAAPPSARQPGSSNLRRSTALEPSKRNSKSVASAPATKPSRALATDKSFSAAAQAHWGTAARRRSGHYQPSSIDRTAGQLAAPARKFQPAASGTSGEAPDRGLRPGAAVGASDSTVSPSAASYSASGPHREPLPAEVAAAPAEIGLDAGAQQNAAAVAGEGASLALATTANAPMAPTSRLAARTVAVLSPALPQPKVQASADTSSTAPVVVHRWAAQVLAGPALTHRHLGTLPSLIQLPRPTSSPSTATADKSANQLSQKERASTGYGVQVQVRRTLTGRWSLSAGLGYQEYASQVTYPGSMAPFNQPGPSTIPRTSPPPYSHRDTYRFVTVPVRFGYALGQSNGRVRYGLLAGADAALYVGGNSPGKEAAPRAWGVSGSPYRSLNAAVSAGIDFRYRLVPGLEILAQPTATYFLTSLPRNFSGLVPRYLFGASALFGLSYEFR